MRHAGLLALCLGLLAPSAAHAAPGRVLWPVGGEPTCEPLPYVACNSDDQCIDGECASGACLPADEVICSTNGATQDCPRGTVPDIVFEIEICAPDNPEYCGRVEACYSAPNRPASVVRYSLGDCDGDGIRNGAEDGEAAICSAERAIGVIAEDGTCQRAPVCGRGPAPALCPARGHACADVLRPDVGQVCLPPGAPLFCCTDDLFCGDPTATCAPGADVTGLCTTQTYCPGLFGLAAVPCFRFDGSFVVAPEGDCDGDGLSNAAELERGTSPCLDENIDGGVAPVDAGSAPTDAGTDAGAAPSDAGAPGFDAGPAAPLEGPGFRGGGGCACRTGPTRSEPVAGAATLAALLALLLVGRRRPR